MYTQENFKTFLESMLTQVIQEYNKIEVDDEKRRSAFQLISFPSMEKKEEKEKANEIEGNPINKEIKGMLYISNFKKRRRKDKGSIEARASIYGRRISISAKTNEELDERIKNYVHAYNSKISKTAVPVPDSRKPSEIPPMVKRGEFFQDYALKYLDLVKKGDVTSSWYEHQKKKLERYIFPFIGAKHFDEIKIFDCQEIIRNVLDLGFERTSEDVHNLLNQILDYAEVDGLINRNPMKKVKFHKHIRAKGRALTYEEEVTLLDRARGTRYERNVILMLYAGLRGCECDSARISADGMFIISNNAKRKNRNVKESKFIPITPMMKPYLPLLRAHEGEEINTSSVIMWFNDTVHGLSPKMCRHTFNTRLLKFKIHQEFRELAMGHKSSDVNIDTYTHYSDVKDVYYEEFQKVDYRAGLNSISPTPSPNEPTRSHKKKQK